MMSPSNQTLLFHMVARKRLKRFGSVIAPREAHNVLEYPYPSVMSHGALVPNRYICQIVGKLQFFTRWL